MAATILTDEMRRFLEEPRFAVLATVNPDGSPQQTVMWYLLEGDRILMNTKRGRRKDRNIDRDPRVSVCVEDGYRYLALAGTLTADEDPARAQEDIRRLAERYHGREEAARMVAEGFSLQERVTLRLAIERIDAHGFGGEG
jgi:PPOX class probable F420-dependent enzyme